MSPYRDLDQVNEVASYRKVGGTDNGKPGLRDYQPGYYAAYVLDPLGNNIEVLHWAP
jgi:hypothetical protein